MTTRTLRASGTLSSLQQPGSVFCPVFRFPKSFSISLIIQDHRKFNCSHRPTQERQRQAINHQSAPRQASCQVSPCAFRAWLPTAPTTSNGHGKLPTSTQRRNGAVSHRGCSKHLALTGLPKPPNLAQKSRPLRRRLSGNKRRCSITRQCLQRFRPR